MDKEKLSEGILKKFNLEDKTQVFYDEEFKRYTDENGNVIRALFLGLDTLSLEYPASVGEDSHYLVRDDPYYSHITGEPYASLKMDLPQDTTHYTLGPKRVDSGVSYGKNKYAWHKEYFPIVFLKVR